MKEGNEEIPPPTRDIPLTKFAGATKLWGPPGDRNPGKGEVVVARRRKFVQHSRNDREGLIGFAAYRLRP